jgi:hypothetical protein
VSAAAGAGADAGRMVVSVATSRPVLAASLGDASVRVLRFDTAAGKWVEPTITPPATATGLSLTVDEAWADATPYQVCLAGTGARCSPATTPSPARRAKPCPPAAAATPACSPPTPTAA